MIERRHYIFRGRVQGVGFRFTCYQLALQRGITGWVRNLSDGSVEAILQGEITLIQGLLAELNDSRFIKIEDFDMQKLDILKSEKTFEMKY